MPGSRKKGVSAMHKDKKQSILIVDDDNSAIMALSYILSPYYTVYTAKNGPGALAAAEKYLPSVVLLDIVMPGMDGYEVLGALKESDITRDIPVVFISGPSRGAGDEIKWLSLGAADYIAKPFNPEIVRLRVRNQMEILNQSRTAGYELMNFKLASEAMHIALWSMEVVVDDPVNPGNRFVWSPEFRSMLGYSDENDFPDVLRSWSDRLHPDDKEKSVAAFKAHINDYTGKTPYYIEYRLRNKSG